MQLTIDEIFAAAMSLDEDERMELVDRLIDTLPPPAGIMSVDDPGFHDELLRRSNDRSEAIPWTEMRDND
jgi:putative addiction module component (TIGR02574 family)